MFSTNVVEFKEPGVGVVELVNCVCDLLGETNGGKELVGESRVDTVKALAPIIGESCVVVAKQFGDFDAEVFG